MTGQHTNVAVQNLRMLRAIVDVAKDGGNSVMISWYTKYPQDAKLPYDERGRQCGITTRFRKRSTNLGEIYIAEYVTIENGKTCGKSITIFSETGQETAIYSLPSTTAIRQSLDVITTRLPEFLVWSPETAEYSPGELANARMLLCTAFREIKQAKSTKYLDEIVQQVAASGQPPENGRGG